MTLEERLEGIVAGTQKKEAVEAILSWFKEQVSKNLDCRQTEEYNKAIKDILINLEKEK